jgi:hypothetical protein
VAELSVFVDESGDFGPDSDYYVLALVLHDQSQSIAGPTARLAEELAVSGLNTKWAIHTGAAIRGEDVYRGIPFRERKREFNRLFAFARRVVPAQYRLFQVADLHRTLELLRIKLEDHKLSRSDLYFFGRERTLRKDYLSKLGHKRFGQRKAKP